MDTMTLVKLAMGGSVLLSVLALGLGATTGDVLAIMRRPGLLLRSLVSMNLIMPAVAVALALSFALAPAVKIALVALSLSPVWPHLPKRQFTAGGRQSFVDGLFVVAGLFAVVFVPLALELLQRIFGVELQLTWQAIAKVIFMSIVAPLGLGMVIRAVLPGLAVKGERPLAIVSALLYAIGVVAILVISWPAMMSLVGSGTLVSIVAFIIIGLVVGTLLGGPDRNDRAALALASAGRHPGVALLIAGANFPSQKLFLPAVILYAIANTILSIPFIMWAKTKTAPQRQGSDTGWAHKRGAPAR